MPLYPVFILLMAVGLREQYVISASAVMGLLLWSPRWRRPAHDLQLLLLAALVLTFAPIYLEWRQWYRYEPPEVLVGAGAALRQWLTGRIGAVAHGRLASFLQAVLVGDKGGLQEDMIAAFGVLGIRHMLAVSGFHVGIWTSMLLPLTKVHQHRYWQWSVQLVLVVFLVVYASAVGGGPSVVRAVGSFALARIALAGRWKVASMHWPMAVGVGCFLVEPEMVGELGFQLSYAAVLAILFVLRQSPWAEFMHHYQMVKHPTLPLWLLTVQISLAAWIGTLPLVSHHFGGASPYFLLGNLLVVPVYTLFIWTGLGAVFLGPFMPKGCLVWWNVAFEYWDQLVLEHSLLLGA
jgi:ComEC/Rec2-related protein